MNRLRQRRVVLGLLVVLACLLIVTAWRVQTQISQMPDTSDQNGSVSLPSQVRAGGTLTFTLTWQSRPTSRASSTETTTKANRLTVLLVDEHTFRDRVCGAYHAPVLLDVLLSTGTVSLKITRTVQIPPRLSPGSYEVVREITRGSVSSCASTSLLMLPASQARKLANQAEWVDGVNL